MRLLVPSPPRWTLTAFCRNPFPPAIMKPRSRIVVFRITEEQHAQLKTACARDGARTLSEFARSSVLRASGAPSLARIEETVNEVKTAVEQLTEMVVTSKS